MSRWRSATDEAALRARIARQLEREKIPAAVWRRAIRQEYVREALDRGLKKDEESLRRFVQESIANLLRQSLGYRKPGGRGTGLASDLYDAYTRARWKATGEPRVPADIDFAREGGRDVVVVWARPWVPPAVVARLYAFLRQSFPNDVHGPQLKSLNLYNFVNERRTHSKEPWAVTMGAWNDWLEESGQEGTVYNWVSNFHRDYHRVKRTLGRRR